MNGNLGKEGGRPSIEWLKGQLQGLLAVEPPASLRGDLLAGIPSQTGGVPIVHRVRPWSRGIRWAIAAAVVVAGSAVVWLGLPGGQPVRSVIDVNSRHSLGYASDHNSLRLSDTNLCDINGLR